MKPFYLSRLIIPVILLLGINFTADAQTTYSTPGGPYVYTVPAGVSTIGVDLAGAQGGTYSGVQGGLGGRVVCNLAVTPGLLYIYVGGSTTSTSGGVNGGANGAFGGGGGGASDIRTGSGGYTTNLGTRLVVGGGGGGATYVCYQSAGGAGGYPNGASGTPDGCFGSNYIGSGGTQSSGGSGPVYGCGAAGSFGSGGNGNCGDGGGGGGGWYGGGGSYFGPGAGGSSYAGPSASGVQYTNGYETSNGYVTIYGPTLTASPSSLTFGPQTVGTRSVPPQYITVGGSYMGASPLTVTVSCPNFLISTDGVNWVSSTTISYTGATFSGVNIFVKFAPSTAGAASCNLSISGGGLASPTVIPLTGTGANPCTGTGTLFAGVSSASPTTGNQYSNITLNLTGTTAAGGLNYQWASAPTAGGPWTPITGAITPNYTVGGITATTYYQASVNCPVGGGTSVSVPTVVTYQSTAPAVCTSPTAATPNTNHFILGSAGSPFVVTGDAGSAISDNYNIETCCPNIHYVDNTATMNVNMSIGGRYGGSTGVPYSAVNVGAAPIGFLSYAIWIDFNNDGNFTANELVSDTTWNALAFPATPVGHPLIVIPSNVQPGKYRMRAEACQGTASPGTTQYPYASGYPGFGTNMTPCPTASQNTSDVRDYSVTITAPACSGTPNAGIADISQITGCAVYTTNLFNVASQQGQGITYLWYSSPDGSPGSYNPVGGAIGTVFTPTINAFGSTTFYEMKVTCSNSGLSSYTNPVSAALFAPPSPITSSLLSGFNLCTFGNTSNLNSSPAGGVWSSSNTSVAAVGSTSGLLQGQAVGYSTITYTSPIGGCTATQQVTVNALPGPISGSLLICQGSTTALSDPLAGGTWSFVPTPTFGSINAATGVAYGAITPTSTPNLATITYTIPSTQCAVQATLTINPLPGLKVVGGGGSYCVGSTSTLHVTLSGSDIGINYQLVLDGSVLANVPGTGGPMDFGVQSAPGVYTVFATNGTTGCGRQMIGSETIAINPLPLVQSLTGGGSFCTGDPGRTISVTGSQVGAKYYLMTGGGNVDSLVGTGAPLTFSAVSVPGIYTVNAVMIGSGCSTAMTGSIPVIANPLPAPQNVTGGGTYCFGTSGKSIGLDLSQTGVNYQLFNGATPMGSSIPGTGGPISFGNQTVDGLYIVVATNTSTTCHDTMNGTATIAGKGLPDVEIVGVTNNGHFCAGSAGPTISVGAPTQFGVNYCLYQGSTLIACAMGNGGLTPIAQPTVPGTYTVVATDVTTLCSSNMSGSVTIVADPLPTAWTLSGGGNYCNGAAGPHITLNGSNTGISYFVVQSSTGDTLTSMGGTGASLDFGSFTITDNYTAVAINNLSGCSKNMNGVVSVGLNPLPAQHNVTGTGNYCSGTAGQPVGLDFSDLGIRYQLYRDGTALGSPVTGTGASISFGPQSVAATYTVIGTNTTTTCVNTMAGNAVVGINPLPTLHLVTGGGNYCSGGAGVNVGINGSDLGTNYQLYLGITPVGGTVAGTGLALPFGLQTAAGNYTIQATDATTGCVRFMAGNANVVINAAPTAFSVTGGGIFCAGGAGVHIGLSGSAVGVRYQLYNGGTAVGSPALGSGSTVDFGAQAGAGTYTVVGTNGTNGCTNAMTGNTTIATQPLPTSYSVTGGGSYCAGGSGVDVMLSNSDPGIDYTLYHGSTVVGSSMSGTGSSLDFGLQSVPGNYTVKGVDATTGCLRTMASTATISIDPLPNAYTVIGGGSYCAGGTGVHVFLSTSTTGVSYQLYNGPTAVGSAVNGTGATLDFGLNTAAGSYTVTAQNTSTTCANNMTGAVAIAINALPSDFTVTGGGSYCTGGSGVAIGLNNSESSVRYQLYNGLAAVGTPINGTGSAISFGSQTAAGTYTVYAVNNSTTCANTMTTSANVAINPLPTQYTISGGGNYCATGIGVHVGLSNSDAGINYQLYYGGTATGVAVPGTGGPLDLGLQTAAGVYTVIASNGTTSCSNAMTGSTVVNVIPTVLPSVNIVSSATGVVCADQLVNFVANPVNGGTAPTYQWSVNGITTAVGSTYNYIPVNGDVVMARIHSNAQCAIPDTGSGMMVMTVSPKEMPSATVSVNPGSTVCTGATAFFTASTMFGGTSPVLTWLKNGVTVATGTASYSYVPVDGDVITFELGSNFNCRLADNVFSAPIALTVQNPVLPTVAVTANPGTTVAPGQSVTFTATPTHAGSNPTYQWVINNVPVRGATNATFTTSNINNGDSVSCDVTGICAMVGFNSVKMSVRTTGIQQVSANGSDIKLLPNPNKGEFSLKGSLASSVNEEASIEVTDMIGQVVYSGKAVIRNGNIDEHITLSGSLANGMYLLNLRSGADNIVLHFVVEK